MSHLQVVQPNTPHMHGGLRLHSIGDGKRACLAHGEYQRASRSSADVHITLEVCQYILCS